ncbi:hypothetical protein T492DRAFT_1059361 [Pavlovales sp. CCMP2436]|nr:hypothetical protein T492DRAFT_1059361 [Pavlovales sp. CCMP2436]|mmetsp:Transcript_31511/g.73381  ORF Transcript_31511/g.73381 Transcript_31511/m.73381 type:complete len:357 (+) Transcript_31511:1-1071(+)
MRRCLAAAACLLLAASAAAYHPQQRPGLRVQRVAQRGSLSHVCFQLRTKAEEVALAPDREASHSRRLRTKAEEETAPPPDREVNRSRRLLLDAAVLTGLAFYLGGLFGQLTDSQLVLALHSLRLDVQAKAVEDEAAAGAAIARGDGAAGFVGVDARAAKEYSIKTVAINSGVMYLLGVICSPAVVPLLERAKSKLDKAQPGFFQRLTNQWLWTPPLDPADEAARLATRFDVTISQKVLHPFASGDRPSALGEYEASRLGPDYYKRGVDSFATTITVPASFRRLELPPVGGSSGYWNLVEPIEQPVRIVSRRSLQLAIPTLLPREGALLLFFGLFVLLSSVWPCFGLVAVRFTLVRS